MSALRTTRLCSTSSTDVDTAERLFALMAEVFEEERAPLGHAYVERLLAREELWVLAAFIDDELVGGLTAHTLPMTRTESSEVFIYDLAVRAVHQRKGVGRALVTTLQDEAAALGIDDVFVAADDEDLHALDFYRALGGEAGSVTMFTFARARRSV